MKATPTTAQVPAAGHMRPSLRVPAVDEILARASRRLRLPCPVLAAIVSGVVLIPLGQFFPRSMLLIVSDRPGMGIVHDARDFGYWLLIFGIVFYFLVAIRWMRARAARTLSEVDDLAHDLGPDRSPSGRDPFAWAADGRAPLAAAVLLAVLLAEEQLRNGPGLPGAEGLLVFAVDVAEAALQLFVLFSFVWAYLGSVAGLAAVCRRPLRLVSHLDDPFLGTRPLGNLSVALASAYFVGLSGMALWLYWADIQVLYMVSIACAFAGLGLFFLPLYAVHVQMVAEKAQESAFSAARFRALFEGSRHAAPMEARTNDLMEALVDVHAAIGWGYVNERIAAIRTWPFSTAIIARLATTFALPMLLAVLTRVTVLTTLAR